MARELANMNPIENVWNIMEKDVGNQTLCKKKDTWTQVCEYVLKTVSFGSKDCTKELQLECTNFLGKTS